MHRKMAARQDPWLYEEGTMHLKNVNPAIEEKGGECQEGKGDAEVQNPMDQKRCAHIGQKKKKRRP